MQDYTVIVYHAGCPDGATAAVIAQGKYPQARLYPMNAGGEIKEMKGQRILMVDVSVRFANLIALAETNECVTIFDHHDTAQKELGNVRLSEHPNVRLVIDQSRSGAGITWDELAPNAERPRFVNYIEDHDTWRFSLPNSRILRTGFALINFSDLEEVENTLATFNSREPMFLAMGESILKYQMDILFPQMQKQAFTAVMGGRRVLVAPCSIQNLTSEFGDFLVKKYVNYDFVMLWFELTLSEKRKRRCMLRGDGKCNLADLAREHGGGGHPNAAGFMVSEEEFFDLFTEMHPKVE